MSPTTLPPRRSPTLGSWLPVTQIHSRSSCMMCRISSSSRPMRPDASTSCRLSPRAMTRAGAVAVDGLGEALQRLARVVGRHELAALGERGALLEMQIGDDQRVLARPVERARHVGTKQLAANRDCLVLEVVEGEALRLQLEHSISSNDGSRLRLHGGLAQQLLASETSDRLPADLQQDRHRKRRYPVQAVDA